VKSFVGITNKSGRLVQLSQSYYLCKKYEGVLFQGNVEGIGRSEERRHAKNKNAMISHSNFLQTKFAQQLIVDILTDATILVRKAQSVSSETRSMHMTWDLKPESGACSVASPDASDIAF
jgi:hypothetical protein